MVERTFIAALAAALLVSPLLAGPVLAAPSGAPTAPAPPADTTPAGPVVVHVTTSSGDGCRAGTFAIAMAPDNSAIVLIFSSFAVAAGVDAAGYKTMQSCQLTMSVATPAGYQFWVNGMTFQGYASLPAGARATASARWANDGAYGTDGMRSLTGPHEGDWQGATGIGIVPPPVGPCGKAWTVTTSARLQLDVGTSDPTTTTSFVSMDSVDGTEGSIIYLGWRPC